MKNNTAYTYQRFDDIGYGILSRENTTKQKFREKTQSAAHLGSQTDKMKKKHARPFKLKHKILNASLKFNMTLYHVGSRKYFSFFIFGITHN